MDTRCDNISDVCSDLKPGVSGVSLDYEHVSSPLWRLLLQKFFENFSVSKFLKTGIILPLLKGQLQRCHKLISNDRMWPSEHGFEVIFEKSLRFWDIGLQSQELAQDPFPVSLVFRK